MSLLATLITQAVKKVQENNRNNPDVETADESVFDKLKDKIDQAKAKAGDRDRGRGGLFDQLRDRIEDTRKENEADPNVNTADPSVFDDMQRELAELKAKIAEQERVQQNKEHDERLADLKAQAEEEKRRAEEANKPKIVPPTVPRGLDDLKLTNVTTPNTPQAPRGLDDLTIPNVTPSFPTRPKGKLRATPPTPPPPSPNPNAYVRKKTHQVVAGASGVTNSMGGSLAIRMHPELNSPQSVLRVPDKSLVRLLQYTEETLNVDGMESRWVEIEYNGERGWILERYLNFN